MPKPTQDAEVTLIGCPGCAGVLSLVDEGRQDYARYVCSIGHAYSLRTLLEAKEKQVEDGLWAVLSVLEQLGMVYGRMLEQVAQGDGRFDGGPIERRLRQVQHNMQRLREMIESEEPAAVDRQRSE